MQTAAEAPVTSRQLAVAVAIAGALAVIAALWREPPYVTDRDVYQQIGRSLIIPDCSSLHCTRVLVPSVLERLPIPSLLSWKLYAVLANTIAALGAARLARRFGASERASWYAAGLVAFGRGSQLTLFDPYSADPFVYALVPWMMDALLGGRFWMAGLCAAVGVFAKEFAAAPLWIMTFYGVLARRRDVAIRAAFGAICVSTLWLGLQIGAALGYNYSYGGNPSSQLQAGGYLATWIRSLGWTHAIASLVLHFGPILLLASVGYRRAPVVLRQLAAASLPVVVVLTYVQQPDRAWWNFEWALAPLAALSLDRAVGWQPVVFMASYALVNLPVFAEAAVRARAAPFVVCAGSAILLLWSRRGRPVSSAATATAGDGLQTVPADAPVHPPAPTDRRLAMGAASVFMVAAVLLLLGLDIAAHRAVENAAGVNVWGYRGPVSKQKQPGDVRVVILDGLQIFGQGVEGSIPGLLEQYLNIPWMQRNQGYTPTGALTVVNLASPYDGVRSFQRTLADYQSLRYDVVCLYLGGDEAAPDAEAAVSGWRRQSPVFRATGYLPMIPTVWRLRQTIDEVSRRGTASPLLAWDEYARALSGAIDDALARGARVLVATNPSLRDDEVERQDRMSAWLADRYGSNPKIRHQDLRNVVDSHAPGLNGYIAESLSQNVFRLLVQR